MKLYRKKDPSKAPSPIYKDQYLQELANISDPESKERAKAAFEKAWESRNFEIELYWKRAAYFWTLQIPVFGAYFAIASSSNFKAIKTSSFLVCCIGVIVSCAWHLINVGSKSWQRHWEHHIDYLEDNFTGPLYKTVTCTETYSVSKINELVSLFFAGIWIILAISYLLENNLLCFSSTSKIAFKELFMIVLTLFVIWQMVYQHGKGLFQNRTTQFYRRRPKINAN